MTIAAIADYRLAARRRLPPFLFEYIDGGSYDQVTLARNVEDLRAVTLRQRVLRDVSALSLETELFGQTLAMPVILAPVGLAGLNARRGEVQAARVAERLGVPFTLSTVSACSLEEVRAGVQRPFWFQLYILRDRGFMRGLLARARAVGCETLVFTVDLPMPGARYRDIRSGLSGGTAARRWVKRAAQIAVHPAWAWDVGVCGRPHSLGNVNGQPGAPSGGLSDFIGWLGANFDPSVTWADLDWIRAEWPGRLIIKGILDPEDARAAARLGADGIVVSNHGGRQLDGVVSAVRALPRIADEVGDQLTVLADGGIRSGLDVVRMLALGAKGVMLGRAWAYALAARGGPGVEHMVKLIAAEMRVAMGLTGVTSIAAIDRGILEPEPGG